VTDLDTIFAAILDRPDDDTPRLAYADFLEDHRGVVACPECSAREFAFGTRPRLNCPLCHGTGEESNGYAERAEFIRVQVELARTTPAILGTVGDAYPNGQYHELRRRERELWVGHSREWFNRDGITAARLPTDTSQNNYGTVVGVVRRGFVDEVRCDLRTWCGGECERCGGNDPDGRDYVRGADCPTCHGTGRTSGIGPAVVRAHPVQRVVLTDREPQHYVRTEIDVWGWRATPDNQPYDLPQEVWLIMRELCASNVRGSWVDMDDRAAALNALSAALLQWAKSAPVA
jgi:hypothetical protein